ncbi:MAG: tyrosine-protein phosphatase [Bacilli bacterium]|nr:tyrosine-protein phosphatase [Bacilli bacterium]
MKKPFFLANALLLSLCAVGCSGPEVPDDAPQSVELESPSVAKRIGGRVAEADVTVPWNDAHTPAQYAYLMGDYDKIDHLALGNEYLSTPKGITLTFQHGEKTALELSKYSDFSESKVYEKTLSGEFQVYNLEIGTDYYYRPYKHSYPVYHFSTADLGPRNLKMDGVDNVRDLGGYVTTSGKRIKQGLYYRGGQWNTGKIDRLEWCITDEGKSLVKELGIKTEIDLRMEGNEMSRTAEDAIEGVTPILIPIDYNNAGWYMDKRKDELLKVFEALTNLDNYPLYLHCRIGTDRTGISSFLLGALLGMQEEDLYRDYMFSNFGKISGSRESTTILRYINYLKNNFEADTLEQSAYLYLTDLGIAAEKLDALKAKFLA